MSRDLRSPDPGKPGYPYVFTHPSASRTTPKWVRYSKVIARTMSAVEVAALSGMPIAMSPAG